MPVPREVDDLVALIEDMRVLVDCLEKEVHNLRNEVEALKAPPPSPPIIIRWDTTTNTSRIQSHSHTTGGW